MNRCDNHTLKHHNRYDLPKRPTLKLTDMDADFLQTSPRGFALAVGWSLYSSTTWTPQVLLQGTSTPSVHARAGRTQPHRRRHDKSRASCGAFDACTMTYLKSVNSVPVSFDDLWEICEEANALHESGERDFEALMFLIARHYKGEPVKAGAVLLRMQALARLVGDEGAPGWTLPKQADGSVATQEAVFAAAAVQPLVEIGNNARFEREPFLAKVLELAETEGRA